MPSQHLLVLLFGTFYMVSEASDTGSARMTPDALGISVAPSLFHSCIHLQEAKFEDVLRSKVASEVISKVIQNFGHVSLFPRQCYDFYARMTGRTIRVDENAVKLLFVLPNNAYEAPVPPATPFSRMAAKCAGSYSLSAVSELEKVVGYDGKFFQKEGGKISPETNCALPSISAVSMIVFSKPSSNLAGEDGEMAMPTNSASTSFPYPGSAMGSHDTEIAIDAETCQGTATAALPTHRSTLELTERDNSDAESPLQRALSPEAAFVSTAEQNNDSKAVEGKAERSLAPSGGLTVVGPRLSSSACEVRLERQLEEITFRLDHLRYGEAIDSTHSLSYLSLVHARQLRRMVTRSEWFLAPLIGAAPSTADKRFTPPSSPKKSGHTVVNKTDEEAHNGSDIENRASGGLASGKKNRLRRIKSWKKHYMRPERSIDDQVLQAPQMALKKLLRRCSMGVSIEKAISHRTVPEAVCIQKTKLGRCRSNVETVRRKKK